MVQVQTLWFSTVAIWRTTPRWALTETRLHSQGRGVPASIFTMTQHRFKVTLGSPSYPEQQYLCDKMNTAIAEQKRFGKKRPTQDTSIEIIEDSYCIFWITGSVWYIWCEYIDPQPVSFRKEVCWYRVDEQCRFIEF